MPDGHPQILSEAAAALGFLTACVLIVGVGLGSIYLQHLSEQQAMLDSFTRQLE